MPDDGLWSGWEDERRSGGASRALLRRRRLAAAAALVLLVGLVVLALTRGSGDPPAPSKVTLLDALAPLLGTGAAPGDEDDAAVKLGIPLDRAAAQLFLVGFSGTGPQTPFLGRLRQRDWGGVVLTQDNWRGSRRRLGELTRAIRRTAARAGHTPPLVVARAPGGPGNAVPDVGPPLPASVAGPAEAEDTAREAAQTLSALGVQAVLGPPLSLAISGGPWEDRGFAEDAGQVTQRAGAAVRGWQSAGVVAIPGRFPGEGAASQDPGVGPAAVGLGLPELQDADLKPFRGLASRVAAVQMSGALYAAFDGVTPATLLPEAVALLREVAPETTAVSADLQAVTLATGGTVADAAVEALRAGCDLLYVPGDAADQQAAFRAVVRAIRSGKVEPDRVAQALERAAALKRAARVTSASSG